MSDERDPERQLLLETEDRVNSEQHEGPPHVPLEPTTGTKRQIGWISAFMIVMSRVIGSGIFAMPGTVLRDVGSPGLALLLWVIGAFIASFGLTIDLEYGCMFPRSGGIKVYLEQAYPKPKFLASTMVAVQFVLLGFTASNCIIFAKYIWFSIGGVPTDFKVKVTALILLTLVTVIHGCFYQSGLWIQNFLGMLKMALIFIMMVTGVFVVLFRSDFDKPGTLQRAEFLEESNWNLDVIATTLFKIFYSYAGLDNMNNVLTEVKNPVRTLKTVAPTALITSCLMYLLVNLAYFTVIPIDEIKQSQELVAGLFFERIFGPGVGKTFLSVAIAISSAGNVMVVTFSLARIKQEIARQGLLPFSSLFASSKPFGSPLGGLLIHYLPSLLVIVLSPSDQVYGFIANIEGYAAQFFAIAAAKGILILRKRSPNIHRPYRTWKSAVYLRIILCLALIVAPFITIAKGGSPIHQLYAFVALGSIMISSTYWLTWTNILPRVGHYRLEEKERILSDGTRATGIVQAPM